MQVYTTISALRADIHAWKQSGLKIGFVPTMGNLHQGHLSLVEKAQTKADKVVVSIFVNPLQFGEHEDLGSYPRTFEADKLKLEALGVDGLFFPTEQEMYPNGRQQQTQVVAPNDLTTILEGAIRPGHFNGVTTVVAKLFNMVQPDIAVFGQKDFQQYRVLTAMVNDLNMPIEMIMAPIARAEDGLALSSRNQYLTPEQRRIAPQLWRVLQTIAQAIQKGNDQYSSLIETAKQQLLTAGFDAVDYIEMIDSNTLKPAKNSKKQPGLAILAVAKCGQTRLLDNIIID